MWDLNDDLTKPETFARVFCADLDIPGNMWIETIANQIRAQIEEYEGLATMDLGNSAAGYEDVLDDDGSMHVDVPECRVILSVSFLFMSPNSIDSNCLSSD